MLQRVVSPVLVGRQEELSQLEGFAAAQPAYRLR